MDSYLKDKIVSLVDMETKLAGKIDLAKQDGNLDFSTELNNTMEYSKVLQLFQQKYIEGNLDYTYIKVSLKDLISELVKLNVVLNKQQQENIEFTNRAMKTKDDSEYLLDDSLLNASSEKGKKIIHSVHDRAMIEKLINETESRYTKSFGEFTDGKMATTILEKEFRETIKYLNVLQTIYNIQFNQTDDLTPLISSVNSVIYEAVQLSAVIKRVERYLTQSKVKVKSDDFKPIYIMMDGIDSSKLAQAQGSQYF